MGVPLLFKKLTEEYDDIIIDNPEKKEIKSNLFIDMNCAIHPCCKNILDENYSKSKKNSYENKMLVNLKLYLEKIVSLTNPKFIYMAIDGVAPCAKMKQQRQRRYKSILDKENLKKINNKLNIKNSEDSWDSNCISPGTEFMLKLSQNLKQFILKNEMFKDIEIIFSDSTNPGEGEHKILDFLKNNIIQGDIIIYGLDADLIMLSLVNEIPNIYLLREAIEFGKVIDGEFLYMDIDELKCNILQDFKERYILLDSISNQTILEISDNLIKDYIFICFLLGNDFLPHMLSLNLKYNGLDIIMNSYINTFIFLKEHLILKNNKINLFFLKYFIKSLADSEDKLVNNLFKIRKKMNKYTKIRSTNDLDREKEILNNYPILNMDKEFLITNDNIYCKDWKDRYYYHAMNIKDEDQIEKVCKNYLEGLYWTTNYYFNKCISWSWYYKYGHPPTLKDFSFYLNKLDKLEIKLDKSKPVPSIVQLLTILPQNSINLIHTSYRKLITDIEYGLIHLYPEKFEIDTLFKRYYWQCEPILPDIDIELIKKKVSKITVNKAYKNQFNKSLVLHKNIRTELSH